MSKLCHHPQKLRTTFHLRNTEGTLVILSVPDPGEVQFIFQMKAKLFLTRKLGCLNKYGRIISPFFLVYTSSSQGKLHRECEVDHSVDLTML